MNFNITNIIIGLIGIAIGVLTLKEAYYINNHIYFLDFIERKYGPGTGTLAYRLIGLLTCVLSIFVIVGLIDIANGSNRINNIQTNNTSTPSNITTPANTNRGSLIAP
jgi:hypothetical protein